MPQSKHDSTSAANARSQPDKFRDLARELECDEDEAKFEETVKRVAQKPKAQEPSDPT